MGYTGVCSEFMVASRQSKGTELLEQILSLTTPVQFNRMTNGAIYNYRVFVYNSTGLSSVSSSFKFYLPIFQPLRATGDKRTQSNFS
jgi:hypothetical protein